MSIIFVFFSILITKYLAQAIRVDDKEQGFLCYHTHRYPQIGLSKSSIFSALNDKDQLLRTGESNALNQYSPARFVLYNKDIWASNNCIGSYVALIIKEHKKNNIFGTSR